MNREHMKNVFGRIQELSSPYRVLQHKYVKFVSQRFMPEAHVLDAGASQYKPFYPYFKHTKYVSCDIDGTGVDYKCSVTDMPFPNESLDCILCTEVLEHVPEPKAALKEFHRVLGLGGHLIITSPFLVIGNHGDFIRWSEAGLRMMLKDAGFECLDVTRSGGVFGVMAENIRQMLPSLFGPYSLEKVHPISYLGYGLISVCNLLLIPACHFLAFWDFLDVDKNHCLGFHITAIKGIKEKPPLQSIKTEEGKIIKK